MKYPDVTVQIMAGGRSRRMGTDKAAVRLGGKTLLDRAAEEWNGWGRAMVVSVGTQDRVGLAPAGTTAVCDIFPGCGPLGGLHGGLAVCATGLLLLRAVDTPFLLPCHAVPLLSAIGQADACVYALEGRQQPLFGLYRVSACLPAAQYLLTHDERRMYKLLETVVTVNVPTREGRLFRNLNTPEELAAAEKEILLTDKEK